MVINHKDIKKILSVLNLTESNNDHEALLAIRTANSILKKSKCNWNDFFGMKKEEPRQTRREKSNEEEFDVKEMITYIRDYAWSTFDFSFIDSIEQSYYEYKSLTRKQYGALLKIYNTIKNRRE